MASGPLPRWLRGQQRTLRAELGVTAIEYALMVAIIVALLAAVVLPPNGLLYQAVSGRFDRDANCAGVAYKGGGC